MKKSKSDFDICLKNKRIIPSSEARSLVSKELSEALVDLEEARDNVSRQKYKWGTIQAYYAMFHAARALLYSQGYRERSHFCVLAAIEHLFGKAGLLEMRLVRAFGHAMSLREDADYAAEYSKEGAEQILKKAEDFYKKAQIILR